MPNAISAHYTDAKLPAGCPVDDKIDVFEDWMNGWLLLHAYALSDEAYKLRTDAGFAILMLTTAYFEPIESYHTGRPSHPELCAELANFRGPVRCPTRSLLLASLV